MARKFKAFVERPKPRKRPRRHTKKLNKHNIFIKFGCYQEQKQQGQPTKFVTLVKLW